MSNNFKLGRWIWYTDTPVPDSYGDFKKEFNYEGGNALCKISVDGDYTLFVNGTYAASNQYGDFEHYKIYDTIDITSYLREGENEIYILVWHLGIGTSRYKPGKAGLIFEVFSGDDILCYSDESSLCRQNPYYRTGLCKLITRQLGQSFLYDATATEIPFGRAVIVDKKATLFPRPTNKAKLLPEKNMTVLKDEGTHFLIDLGEESVGLPVLRFYSDKKQKLLVTWGEHIADGGVRRIIGERDFSFEYIAKTRENDFTNYMLRLGCRYLEIFCEEPITLHYGGLIPQQYPVKKIEKHFDDELDKKIYDLCVRTLELSMMEEHYVDTPWREQCFYSFDSRNQMLCGYRAFEGGNMDYAAACLKLISKDERDDGLLNITYPSGGTLAIPSFSLHYFTAVREFMEAGGSPETLREVFPKLSTLIDVFRGQIKNGLLWTFPESCHWNFYDWSAYNDEHIGTEGSHPDLMINCLFILALDSYKAICKTLNEAFMFDELAENLRRNTRDAFFIAEEGLFTMIQGEKQYSELGNSAAILAGLCDKNESIFIAEKMSEFEMAECSLSCKCFKYDAMLVADSSFITAVKNEIRSTYKLMIDAKATSVWEVIEGESAFDNAGSLCHGWSAIPILYL